jgi:hypothetical protein
VPVSSVKEQHTLPQRSYRLAGCWIDAVMMKAAGWKVVGRHVSNILPPGAFLI